MKKRLFIQFLFVSIIVLVMALSSITQARTSTGNVYLDRFFELYDTIHTYKDVRGQGYFSPEGNPYHALETMIIEAPDYGHETTSETYSYYVWLEAMYGRLTKDWNPLVTAWNSLESNIIPSDIEQPNVADIPDPTTPTIASSPGRFSRQSTNVEDYPTIMTTGAYMGDLPETLTTELWNAYGTNKIYGMHWLLDSDDFYGFGRQGTPGKKPVFLLTCERGGSESAWNTIPHPCWKDNIYGGVNSFGDISLNNYYAWGGYNKEYSYSVATDADARVVQAMYMAYKAMKTQGVSDPTILKTVENTAKMGDYLRIGMYDKYFAAIGSRITQAFQSTPGFGNDEKKHSTFKFTTAGDGINSCHYLLGWNYCWGATSGGNYPWRIGDSNVHFGYQNPMTAYALGYSTDKIMPKATSATAAWKASLDRQVELIRWLQTAEGAIGGGATNSYDGIYANPPAGKTTFYGMSYDESPVYIGRDPNDLTKPIQSSDSNAWFGWQTWTMQRLAELYYELPDSMSTQRDKAEFILDKWMNWVMPNIKIDQRDVRGNLVPIQIPGSLAWTNQPDTWVSADFRNNINQNYHVNINSWSQDVGLIGSLARTLIYYAKGKELHAGGVNVQAKNMAKSILDRLYTYYKDPAGYAQSYYDKDFAIRFFNAQVWVPKSIPVGYTGDPTTRVERKGSLPAQMGTHDPNKGPYLTYGENPNVTLDSGTSGMGQYMKFYQIRSNYEKDPRYDELWSVYQHDRNITDPNARQGFRVQYHRFFGQVDIALAMAEFGLFFTNSVDAKMTMDNNGNPTVQIQPTIKVINTGTATLDLTRLSIRYYYTVDGDKPQPYYCDNAGIWSNSSPWYQSINGNVRGRCVKLSPSRTGADYYIEVTFTGGAIPTDGYMEVKSRINKNNWSQYTQTNDYSYNDVKKVMIYYNGTPLWGTEP